MAAAAAVKQPVMGVANSKKNIRGCSSCQLSADRCCCCCCCWAVVGCRCAHPLMRARASQEVRCVVCDLPVMTGQAAPADVAQTFTLM
jgi:hypothetical protein